MNPKIWIITLTALILLLGISLPLAADTAATEDADAVKEASTTLLYVPW